VWNAKLVIPGCGEDANLVSNLSISVKYSVARAQFGFDVSVCALIQDFDRLI